MRVHEHTYQLRGSESRTRATVDTFRVLPAGDLRDGQDRPLDPRSGDLRHLPEQGLLETVRSMDGGMWPGLDGAVGASLRRTATATMSLARSSTRAFKRERERQLEHDAQVYNAYLSLAERLADRDARIERGARLRAQSRVPERRFKPLLPR